MTKQELVGILKATKASVNEGTPEDIKTEKLPRICFWEIAWEPLVASGSEYNTKVTYQVSTLAELPRCREIIELKCTLDKLDIHPIIYHEYDIEKRKWHSFFTIEVLENVS